MPLVEMQAVLPDKPFDPDVFEREIQTVLEKEVLTIYRLYKRTWQSWEHETPHMAMDVEVGGSEAYGEVYSADDYIGTKKLVWLDDGTAGKTFGPKRRPYLMYQKKFRPKTRRGNILSTTGGKYGKEWVKTRQVSWPGVSAREFSKTIAKIREKRFQQAVSQAFDRAARDF